MITTKLIPLDQITIDAGTQVRAEIDEAVVATYAEAMESGDTFPNVVTFHDGVKWFLADGFHRYFAVKLTGAETIRAEVHQGTRADALKYALSANYAHGLRRTNADKKKSVEIALKEWPKLSSREVARVCAVSDVFVGSVRDQLQTVSSCAKEARIGADGKERKLPAKVPAETASAPTEPPQVEAEQEPPRVTADAQQKALPATEPRVTEYYNRLEALTKDALENATDKQLVSMSVYSGLIPKLIKEELAKRKKRK